jgi:hypothetical protein
MVVPSCDNASAPPEENVGTWISADADLPLSQQIDAAVAEFRRREERYAACVLASGFEYQLRTVEVTVTSPTGDVLGRLDSMRRYGYGITSGEGSQGIVAEVRGGGVTLEQQEAFGEATAGGLCVDEANGFDVQAEIQVLNDEFAGVPEDVGTDARVLAAIADWSTCMKAAGYQFGQPADAFEYVESQYQQASSTVAKQEVAALELRIAGLDADCLESTVLPVIETIREGFDE